MKTKIKNYENKNKKIMKTKMKDIENKKWVVYYGSFNEPVPELLDQEMTKEEAYDIVYHMSIEDFDSYGLHGTRTVEDIMEEDEIEDYDEAYETYVDERETWLKYWVEEYDPEKHDPELEW